jgi:hypothetical protein
MQRLSRETENEFMEYHITKVWNELHDRFGFDIKKWKEKFNAYLQKHPRDVSEMSVFYRFGHDEINPVLNKILCRNQLFPTFNNLVEYVVKKVK